MNLALLGCDEEILEFAKQVEEAGEHRIVGALCDSSWVTRLGAACSSVRRLPSWDSLLAGNDIDVVVVARKLDPQDDFDPAEVRADQLRKLTQVGRTILLFPWSCPSIISFELEMIRQDTGCILAPYAPEWFHPAITDLKTFLTQNGDPGESEIGVIEQLIVDRPLSDRSREAVLAAFCRDAAWIRKLVGEAISISATSPIRDRVDEKSTEESFSGVNVTYVGREPFGVRWLVSAPSSQQFEVNLIGSSGRRTITANEEGWILRDEHAAVIKEYPTWNPTVAILEDLRARIAKKAKGELDWIGACHDADATDAIERSLQRGRKIELYTTAPSEPATFKGIMSAGGCFLLLGGLLTYFVVGVIAFLIAGESGAPVSWGLGQVCFLAPFVLFLAFQLLLPLLAKRHSEKQKVTSSSQEEAKFPH